ncbi:MAG TPA: hypothetical protein VH682_17725 [Gemmataceae bacterium]|jgi:hypothetical protein
MPYRSQSFGYLAFIWSGSRRMRQTGQTQVRPPSYHTKPESWASRFARFRARDRSACSTLGASAWQLSQRIWATNRAASVERCIRRDLCFRVTPGYLPHPFRIVDACVTNASSVWLQKHFYF